MLISIVEYIFFYAILCACLYLQYMYVRCNVKSVRKDGSLVRIIEYVYTNAFYFINEARTRDSGTSRWFFIAFFAAAAS